MASKTNKPSQNPLAFPDNTSQKSAMNKNTPLVAQLRLRSATTQCQYSLQKNRAATKIKLTDFLNKI